MMTFRSSAAVIYFQLAILFSSDIVIADPKNPDAVGMNISVNSVNDTKLGIAHRHVNVINMYPSAAPIDADKFKAYNILGAISKLGCENSDHTKYMTDLGKLQLGQYKDELFVLPPLVRYLFTYKNCLSDVQLEEVSSDLVSRHRPLFGHGTSNMMITQESSWYLLAQLFPERTWTDSKGHKFTSQEVMTKLKDLLQRRHWRLFQSGMDEMLSTTYAAVNLVPLLNLIDFAADKEVVQMAKEQAALEVLTLKVDSFDGLVLPPLTRRNTDELNVSKYKSWPSFQAITQQILWYYFGEPKLSLRGPSGADHHGDDFVLMLALSGWRPPQTAWSLPNTGYALRVRTPAFTKWDDPTFPIAYGDAWFDHDYALATGNFVFNPFGYSDHNQSFALAFKSDAARNMIECQHPYWRSNSGENAWTTDFWSPFLQTARFDEHHAVLLTSIPMQDPWPNTQAFTSRDHYPNERDQHQDHLLRLVQCRIPKTVDQLLVKDNLAFIRKDKVFMALVSLNGLFEQAIDLPKTLDDEFIVLKIREPKTAIFIAVESQKDSFEEFQERVTADLPTYDREHPSIRYGNTEVRFIIPNPDVEHPGYWKALPEILRDGQIMPYAERPVIESPFLSLSGGILKVTGKYPLTIKVLEKPKGVRPAWLN
ncbi:hypothetical protein [Beijerinckia mobilis]|uniref:hypothetical protein n=1 Tax=Beijerinckia mobilis TaxID=231434 RepID=UPI0012EC816C|nr:hypothetical protein [Beijerinckia mobilis]